ncbi:hypothetical protein Tco_0452358 [Tanacetum coccineum]
MSADSAVTITSVHSEHDLGVIHLRILTRRLPKMTAYWSMHLTFSRVCFEIFEENDDLFRDGQHEVSLPGERVSYELESMEDPQDLARSEAHCRALEARVTVLETEVRRHEWQRQAADDLAVQYIMRTQARG